MRNRYCYWSVCDGPYADLMERCVTSARKSGVFKEFHVMTDRNIEGCECYEAHTVEKTDGLFKLIYLKAAISKLLFDYFIWIDADSHFVRNPNGILDAMEKSPIHVPLLSNVSESTQDGLVCGLAKAEYIDVMKKAGVFNDVYSATSAFWIVHHDAIDRVYELAQHALGVAKKENRSLNVSAALGYAMQMLCAAPEKHRLSVRTDLWASDDHDVLKNTPASEPWSYSEPVTGKSFKVCPAIIHVPRQRANLGDSH